MIMVLLNWLYIAMTSFGTGIAVLSFFSWIYDRKTVEKPFYIILAGLVFNTVYAQTWSLFGGVGVAANVVLMLISVISVIALKDSARTSLKGLFERIDNTRILAYIYPAIIILFAYGSSRGYIHYDTSLYHAQSIRWIEEYGVVKGLACLQLRFGYNSSAFVLTALYSFADIFGQSLHTTAGFFCLLGAFQVSDVYVVFKEKRVRHSDFIRIGLLFYLGLIFKEMVSPASDYYAQILIFSAVIAWLDNLERDRNRSREDLSHLEDIYPYAMISILLVFAATVKFSIALLVLLAIKPAIMLIKNRYVKPMIASLTASRISLRCWSVSRLSRLLACFTRLKVSMSCMSLEFSMWCVS